MNVGCETGSITTEFSAYPRITCAVFFFIDKSSQPVTSHHASPEVSINIAILLLRTPQTKTPPPPLPPTQPTHTQQHAMAPVPPAKCLCGGVKLTFRADAQPITAHCFCEHCSQHAGGLSQLTMLFDSDAVTVEDPENLIVTYNVTGTASGQGKPKSFCGRCGCTLFTKPVFYEGKIFVRASLIPGG